MKSTELNRFVITRPVQSSPQDSLLLPSHRSPLGPIVHVDPIASTFSPGASASGPTAAVEWDVSEEKLTAYSRSNNYLSTKSAIAGLQPGLEVLAHSLVTHMTSDRLSDAISTFEKTAKLSAREYADRTKLKGNLIVFWDNLIYRGASKTDLDLVPALVEAIRLSTILHFAAIDPSSLFRLSVLNATAATLALPAAPFIWHRSRPDNLCPKPPASPPCDGMVSAHWPNTKGEAQPLGWGDLKMIKSSLLRYAAGEIAHVENILAGEEHVREFRDLRRTETKDEVEHENQSELTSSLESTEKFSFEQEVARASSQSTDLKAGVSGSYEYGEVKSPTGAVKVNSYLDYAGKSTKEESQKSATKYAKDVVAKATSKLTQRVRTFQSVTTTTEKENKTRHEISNSSQTHRSGVYRWLDKYYLAHVENYGQRFMYEFEVPEPAAFFRYAKMRREEAELAGPPIAPRDFRMPSRDAAEQIIPNQYYSLTDFSVLTRNNYKYWLAHYAASSATPPPSPKKHVEWVQSGGRPKRWDLNTATGEIELPENYVAKFGFITAISANAGWVKVLLDDEYFDTSPQFNFSPRNLKDRVGKIPVSILTTDPFDVNVTIECELSTAGFDAWRIATFDAIMQAYARQVGEYEDKIQQRAAERSNASFGMNPDINRQVEQVELKKSCLEIITGQRFESIDAMRDTTPPTSLPRDHYGYPEFSFSEARNEGGYSQFFEKAFEWINMTYSFAPYFWGRKDGWLDTLKIADVDPLFENFLRSGSARVVVPVRPGYEKDVLDFFSFGWNGMQHPLLTLDDPRYVSIVEELKEQAGIFPGKQVEPERWVVKVPTTLVYLENPDTTLPDYTQELWWQPKLRVLVVDSSANPISSARVTLRRCLKPETVDINGIVTPATMQEISQTSPNGTVPGSYDFKVDEGTYKIDGVDVIDVIGVPSWLPGPGTSVVEMTQDAEVVITLWRLRVIVTDSFSNPVTTALVTLKCQDAAGVSYQIQIPGANGTLPPAYEFLANPGTYKVEVLATGSMGSPITTTVQIFQDVDVPLTV